MKLKIIKKIKKQNEKIEKLKKFECENKTKRIKEEDNSIKIVKFRPFSGTSQEFFNKKKMNLGFLGEFPGFFNKKFNLNIYKKSRENSRLQSKSPKKVYIPHNKKGNGIPNKIIDRINFLGNKFNSPKFIKYYKNKPVKKGYCFDETIQYIVNYSKNHSQLESLMMAFYFVCKEIKFDKECYNNNEETKINQKPENVFDEELATSIGYTNIFEYILKKLEIKYKHIDGYCKLMPKRNSNKSYKKVNFKSLNRTQSARNFNEEISTLNEYINHSWNAIYIKGEWYFCDCLFGSGSIETDKDKIAKLNLKQLDINNNIYNFNGNNYIDNNNNDYDKNAVNNSISDENGTKSTDILDTFNPFYFMTPPELLISTHRPSDDNWQFLYKTLSFKEFYNKRLINYGEFYKNIYKYNVTLLTHDNPFILINVKDKLKIKLKIIDHLIEAFLFSSFGNTKISEVKYLYDESNDAYILEPIFPEKGEYILKINARSIKSTDLLYWPLIEYIIKVDTYFHIDNINNLLSLKESQNKEKDKYKIDILPKLSHSPSNIGVFTPKIVSDYSKIFPPKTFKKICYDKEDFRLIEPKTNFIKKGANIKFKVLIKEAVNVALLDGNHLTTLKRIEDGIFFGQKEIQTNNVSLCCLRGKNVYTEIYKFKVLKEGRIFSSKPFLFSNKRESIIK